MDHYTLDRRGKTLEYPMAPVNLWKVRYSDPNPELEGTVDLQSAQAGFSGGIAVIAVTAPLGVTQQEVEAAVRSTHITGVVAYAAWEQLGKGHELVGVDPQEWCLEHDEE